MLTCIACSKQQFAAGGPPLHEPPEDEDVVDGVGGAIGGGASTPSTRHAIKALTAQVRSRLHGTVFVVCLVGSGRLRISISFPRLLAFRSGVSPFECTFVDELGTWESAQSYRN
jgi:hypothetical protein